MNVSKSIFILAILLMQSADLLFAVNETGAADAFRADFRLANKTLQEVLPESEKLMVSGDVEGANAKLLAAFPESTRTPAQSFLLGNLFFEIDQKKSYSLHQAAAQAEPNNSTVLFEWAMEQHRAAEYVKALDAYRKLSKAKPEDATPYALQADCLLCLNRIDEAIAAWNKSEEAPNGSVEQMEELICAVNREPMPHQQRAKLLAKVIQSRDTNAACDLIALDCNFPRDWWNSGPYKSYLIHDLTAVEAALKLSEDDDLYRTISCAAECVTADQEDAAEIKQILFKYHVLTDAPRSIPQHGGLLTVILNAAIESKAIDETSLHQKIGPLILSQARKGKDARVWNAALFALPEAKPDEQMKLEREGWRATGDARFAAGVLQIKKAGGQLTSNDADLVAALKQFPESGIVQRIAYEVAKQENKITKQQLADAAKAEFKHFSSFISFATIVNRPRSDYLRNYFSELEMFGSKLKPVEK